MKHGTGKHYIGYRVADGNTAYARFFTAAVSPRQPHVETANQASPLPAGSLPGLDQAANLTAAGYLDVETGFTLESDGSARVAIHTRMPGITPEMWHWWFAWHGDQASKYKLWHPLAHLSAQWKDGDGFTGRYVGRTSLIEEYIGPTLEKAAIRFIQPEELGIRDPASIDQVVYICARVGYSGFPFDFGWLVHQIRAVEGGSEMRSRFWMGGPHIQLRMHGFIPAVISYMIAKVRRVPESQARNLMLHCAEEMNHLAGILPEVFREMRDER